MKQENYNPTVSDWMDQVLMTRGKNAQETISYCNKIQEHGEKVKDYNLLGFAQYYRGETYYLLNYVDGMFRNLINAVENLKRAGVHELEAGAYNLLGIVSVNQGNAHFALDYYLSGLEICERHELPGMQGMLEYNIGALYFKYKDYERGRSYFLKSRNQFAQQAGQPENRLNVFYADISIASCFLEEGMLEEAEQYVETARTDYPYPLDELTRLYFWCFQARFSNRKRDIAARETFIQKVTEKIHEKIPIMEVFEDLYLYCRMLLGTEHYEELSRTIQVMEKVTEQVDILEMRQKILSLKIEFFKHTDNRDQYLEGTASYYELVQAAEVENQYTVNSIMGVRFSLEESRKRRHQVELENQVLQQRSEMDPLTGLANRFRLNEFAEKAFQNALIEEKSLAVEILDVDYFKEYNDNYGHQKGDWCLMKIAGVLQKQTEGRSVFCARYGGDEFIIIYEGYEKGQVLEQAKALKARIFAMGMEHEYSKAGACVTISQGICVDVPREGRKVWDYLHLADKMLYQVKSMGRNGIAVCQSQENDIQAPNQEDFIL